MKHLCNKTLIIALLAFVSFFSASNSFAQQTVQNTTISNTAALQFSVGGGATLSLNSSTEGNSDTAAAESPTVFLVDRLIDLSIAQTSVPSPTGISAGGIDYLLQFTLTNESNSNMDFVLDATADDTLTIDFNNDAGLGSDPAGVPDSDQFIATAISIYGAGSDGIDDGGTGNDTIGRLKNVTANGGSATIYVRVTVPGTQVINDFSYISVTARAALTDADSGGGTDVAALASDDNGRNSDGTTGTSNPDVADEVQNVFADGESEVFYDGSGIVDTDIAQNGQISSTRVLVVDSALELKKTSLIIWDNLNAATNPKALPGSFVQYTLTLTNNGTQDYTLGPIVDTITNAEIDLGLLGTSCVTGTTTTDGVVTYNPPGTPPVAGCKDLEGTDNYATTGGNVIKITYDDGTTTESVYLDTAPSSGVTISGSNDVLTVDLGSSGPLNTTNFSSVSANGQLDGGDVLTITFNAIVE
jgi:hypothetical protein